MTKIRFILCMILLTGCIGGVSLFSVLKYVDPYFHVPLSVGVLVFSYVVCFCSFVSVFLFFIKKIYFRWEVGIFHLYSSIRQSFLFSLLGIFWVIFMVFKIPFLLPFCILVILLIFTELFIKSLWK